MSGSPPGDRARASVQVAVSPAEAFEVFTTEIDLWWRQGPAYRIGGKSPGALHFEAGLGGRLFETYEVHGQPRLFEIGRVTAWEPPARLVFEWRGVNFKPDEKTTVEVTFTAQGGGTLVCVEHRDWSTLPDDHPVRHGQRGADFARMMGMWWGGLVTSLRHHLATRSGR